MSCELTNVKGKDATPMDDARGGKASFKKAPVDLPLFPFDSFFAPFSPNRNPRFGGVLGTDKD